jgi:hypothetical protein
MPRFEAETGLGARVTPTRDYNLEMSTSEVIGIVVGVLGVFGTFYFGIRSMFQSSDFESLQRAVRANVQGLYNNIWRMGSNAEEALRADDLNEARHLARGVADMSQTARHTLIAFSKEHAHFVPFPEAAWKPEPLPDDAMKRKSLWRRLFWL